MYLIVILSEQLAMRNHMGGLKELWQQIEGNYMFEIRNGVRPANTRRPTKGFTRSHTYHTFHTNIYLASYIHTHRVDLIRAEP